MDSQLQERLKILHQGGEIDNQIKAVIEEEINFMKIEYGLEITEENGAMFVTHLAMCLMRIKTGGEVDGLNESALAEVKENENYELGCSFCRRLEEKLGIVIPEGEKGYIILHLCNLLNQERGE